jgi:hypothetical protein
MNAFGESLPGPSRQPIQCGRSRLSSLKREWNMRTLVKHFHLTATVISALVFIWPAMGAERAAPIPDFSGLWARHSLGFEIPSSGAGPILNRIRNPDGTSNNNMVVGDYTNPILKPAAAQRVRALGEMSLTGTVFPDPSNQCWPWQVPYMLWQLQIQILQQPDQITILYMHDHQVRRVPLNQAHPAKTTPSWYGDSVGRYEGNTLVIDTVGVKVAPLSMIDMYGTPFSDALHVVERYRLIDYQAAKEAAARQEADDGMFDFVSMAPGLQIEFTVDDPGVFTMPWSAVVTYRRAAGTLQETVCAENLRESVGPDRKVPTAGNPDF